MENWVVIDTNVVLDMLLFEDENAQILKRALQSGQLRWIQTPRMRDELQRVLDYPHIAQRRQICALESTAILAQYDALSAVREVANKAPYTCKDADDQIYIDLAVQHQALLISKDRAVLAMRSRLAKLGVQVKKAYNAS